MFVFHHCLNPNPITKFFVVGLLGLTVLNSIPPVLEWSVILILSVLYFLNGYRKAGIKNSLVFGILFFVPSFPALAHLPLFFKLFISLLFALRLFYLSYAAGKFLVKTSDVGSIISSMDALKIPAVISIPIAVMFRFFPSFKEEKNKIKMAMKIRGIATKNPFKYLEYVAVPLLVISSNIADDISKAAETKCIANPIQKTRYIKVSVGWIDLFYALSMLFIVAGGWLWTGGWL